MAQTSVTAAPGQVGAIQADRRRVRSDVRDSAIRSGYKAVRSATSSLAASMFAEYQMVQSCPEASPMKWRQAQEWTASAYTGYPGYKPLPSVLGEYNGKFMHFGKERTA